MEASSLKIEKLRDKENWPQWRFVIRTLLEEDDISLDVCEGTLKKPAAENDEGALAAWNKADKKARRLIVTTIEKKPMELIMNCTTASEMWKKLSTVYDLNSDESLDIVQKQFFHFKWEESESVAHNLSRIEQIAAKLKALDSEVKESMVITRVLSSLPKDYSHFHSAWDSVEQKKKTLENLIARLMSEEQRLPQKEEKKQSTALIANNNAKSDNVQVYNKNKSGGKGIVCYNCNRPNHVKKDCFRCWNCKQKGHRSNNCPNPKRLEGAPPQQQYQQRASNYAGNNNGAGRALHEDFEERLGLMASADKQQDDVWVIDSGATDHMTYRRDWFASYEEFKVPVEIITCNGEKSIAYGKGNVNFVNLNCEKHVEGTLYDVLYLPELVHNLFSVRAAGKRGADFHVKCNASRCFIELNGKVVCTGSEYGNLLKLDIAVTVPKFCYFSGKNDRVESLRVWHERLCHQNVKYVKSFLKSKGINFSPGEFDCEGCAYGKMHRLPFRKRVDRAQKVREIIHSDVCGPMEVESLGGKRYYVDFKDDFSSFRMIYFIRQKSEVFEKVKLVCAEIENRFPDRLKELHTDGGKEYDNRQVAEFLNSKGIKFTINAPYTPEHNGIAERDNRIIVEAARSMLYANPNLPKILWAEAMNTAVYILNRTGPTRQGNKTPYELWYGKSPEIGNLKVFGTECFVHIPKEKRRKLDSKAEKGYVVGYHDDHRGYRVYIPARKDVVISRDVLFRPERVCHDVTYVSDNNVNEKYEVARNVNESMDEEGSDDEVQQDIVEPVSENIKNKRQLRDRTKIKQTQFYGAPMSFMAKRVPSCFDEAVKSDEKEEWVAAMRDEMNSLRENQTWILVDAPSGRKVINCRWVFAKKINPDGTDRFKARLVVKGFCQREGIDYVETFSPVARFDTIRFVLSVAACEKLKLGQFDVKTAFLNGKLKEEIYMKQPEGFNDGTSRVCKLLRSLYGLKQAPRCWTEEFSTFIKGLDFYQSAADPCLFIFINGDERVFLVIFVDDGLVAATHEYLIDKLFNKLGERFQITSTREVCNYLGMEISRLGDGSIFINQGKYIREILARFNMSEANSVSTPIECNWNHVLVDKKECKAPYREAVGSLIFLQTVSRPDISFAVNVVSRDLENPTEEHWRLVKRILRYLKGTSALGLLYGKTGDFITFSDADYASDRTTRKSMSGVVCMYANAAVTWQCKKQQCISQSTTEAEYVSAAAAAKEIVWFKKLFSDCKIKIDECVLYVDNTSAIKLIKNPEFHQRSKHIDVKYHYVRDLYNRKEMEVEYVKSKDQLADVFTKALPGPQFLDLVRKIGLRNKNDL